LVEPPALATAGREQVSLKAVHRTSAHSERTTRAAQQNNAENARHDPTDRTTDEHRMQMPCEKRSYFVKSPPFPRSARVFFDGGQIEKVSMRMRLAMLA
jgi:hypothetical protein